MIADIIHKIYRIFIDREEMIKELRGIWKFSCDEGEHFVHVFLNAPGVGKTALIDHFGRIVESEKKGLHVSFTCDSSLNSSEILNRTMVKAIEDSIDSNLGLIEDVMPANTPEEILEKTKRKYERLKNSFQMLLDKETITLTEVQELLKDLARIIPLFFSADEIQELQRISFRASGIDGGTEESGLHYFTRIIKGLLKSKILIVLSGTRYHILSQIGGNIGSPIRQKAKPFHVYNLEVKAIKEYVARIKMILKEASLPDKLELYDPFLENYRRFLRAFSGGHPRTMVIITELFLKNLPTFISMPEYLKYANFMEYLLGKTESYFENTLFTSFLEGAILSLTGHEGFAHIKEWILTKSGSGLSLGKRPTVQENDTLDRDVKNLVYELMNLGVIVQNGQDNYYLTSYFHLIEFLKVIYAPHQAFLLQVMTNKYFIEP